MSHVALTQIIKDKALSLGFNAIGITTPQKKEKDFIALQNYLSHHFQGTMNYLFENAEKRSDIRLLFPDAASIILTLCSYYPAIESNASSYKISAYAYGKDYHTVIKNKLNELLLFIQSKQENVSGYIFCDSAPVFEKSLAVDAGLGWIGKHTLLVHPQLGSFVFIGGIALNILLEKDTPLDGQCPENCTKCIDACPTKAIVKPYTLNASRCIAYVTTENREIEMPFHNPSPYIFGCDICQHACPFNKETQKENNHWFKPQPYVYWSNEKWENLGSSSFKNNFFDSVIKRAGWRTLKRNMNHEKK